MNKLIAALVAGLFATAAFAQASAPVAAASAPEAASALELLRQQKGRPRTSNGEIQSQEWVRPHVRHAGGRERPWVERARNRLHDVRRETRGR
jgi:hypothetical protein